MGEPWPRYLELSKDGELARRAHAATSRLAACDLCPRRCGVDRLAGESGVCGTARLARLSSVMPHFGEEAPLSGSRGSGTLFFAGCNLNCDFCQNHDISQRHRGREVEARQLADAMLVVQELGCHNLNLVTPTHVTPQILSALCLAADDGLRLPVVYNCGGYEAAETLALLDGVVDIYMPDFKFAEPGPARRYLAGAGDYPQVARAALRQMFQQVGDLQMDPSGVARQGLLVRHLVLPEDAAGTGEVIRFLAKEISRDTYLNVMAQYRPCGRIHGDPVLGRRPTRQEFLRAVELAREVGLRLD